MEKNEKKKLLIASDSFLPRWDGIARFLAELLPRIKNDYDITVVAPDFQGGRIRMEGVNIIRTPVSRLRWGDYRIPKFRPFVIKKLVKDADIVFAQSIGPIGSLAIIYAKKFKKPAVSFIHSVEWDLVPKSASKFMFMLRQAAKRVSRYIYNRAGLLIVPSEDTARVFRANMIKTPMKIIHLGVDTSRFCPASSKEEAKKKAGLVPEDIIIGFTGRVGREKDLGTLYKAFRELRKKFDNIRLLIVGRGLELGSIFDSMEDVIQVPVSNKIQDYLQAIDIFVMPSLTETTSLSTMEAMSCSLPVVATGVGNIKYYIKDGNNGYLFEKGDHLELAKKLEKLAANPGLRKGIGALARKTITSKYRWENTVKGIKGVLAEF